MKIELVYLSHEGGDRTKAVEVDMESLMYIRFILSDELQDHIDIDAENDVETKGLRIRGGRSVSVNPDASNSISLTAKWER